MRRRVLRDHDAEVWALVRQGLADDPIGKALGFSAVSIYHYRNAHHIPPGTRFRKPARPAVPIAVVVAEIPYIKPLPLSRLMSGR